MKRLVVSLFLVAILGGPVSAQPPPASNPTFPNVTATGALPDPSGGLFNPGSGNVRNAIRFPNLVSRFTGDDILNDLFGFVLDLLAWLGGLAAFGYLLFGGFKFIAAGSNPAGAEEGKKIIIGAIIGIVIISLAFVVTLFVRNVIVGQ